MPAGFDNGRYLVTLGQGVVGLHLAHQQYYSTGSYSAYAFIFGATDLVLGTDYDASWTVKPSSFPNASVLDWYVPQGTIPHSLGTWGYCHIDYGNYDADTQQVAVTPLQVYALTSFGTTFDWTYSGGTDFTLLHELYLTPSAVPQSGAVSSVASAEIGVLLHAADLTFHNSGTLIGTTHVNGGVTYTVRKHGTFFTVAAAAEILSGSFDWASLLQFLQTQGQITGNEWVNGIAFGVEPTLEAGSGRQTGHTVVNQYGVSSFVGGGTGTAPTNSVLPVLTNPCVQQSKVVQGQQLSLSTGTWAGFPTPTLAYRWKANGSVISGQTASTYTAQAADDAKVITGEVQATNAAGSSAWIAASLAPTAISGTLLINENFTAGQGTWTASGGFTYTSGASGKLSWNTGAFNSVNKPVTITSGKQYRSICDYVFTSGSTPGIAVGPGNSGSPIPAGAQVSTTQTLDQTVTATGNGNQWILYTQAANAGSLDNILVVEK